MRTSASTLSAIVVATLFAALPAPRPVQAATALQRCTTATGGEMFTDKSCSAFGADTAPIPAEMMTRLARTLASDASDQLADASAPMAMAPRASRRPPASGCARSPRQLEADLLGSLALGDVNRIAESYHWAGMSHDDGQRIMSRLEALAGQPVRGIHYFDAQIVDAAYGNNLHADASGARAPLTGSAGKLQLQIGTSLGSVVDLAVERYAGCYFVRF